MDAIISTKSTVSYMRILHMTYTIFNWELLDPFLKPLYYSWFCTSSMRAHQLQRHLNLI